MPSTGEPNPDGRFRALMKSITLPAITLLAATVLSPSGSGAQEPPDYRVTSPDGRIELTVSAGDHLAYRVSMDGETLVSASAIALRLADGSAVGPGVTVVSSRRAERDDWLEPVVPEKQSRVRDHYSALISISRGDGDWMRVPTMTEWRSVSGLTSPARSSSRRRISP